MTGGELRDGSAGPGPEARVNYREVAAGDAAGVEPGAYSVDRTTGNVGTIRVRSAPAFLPGGPGGDRRDAGRRRGWGGAAVVLRARESRAHGKGRQRVSQGGNVMSEDAPGNPGAVAWPDDFTASVRVRRMQAKLHRWAGDDSSRRFGDLFNVVYDPAFLVHAWERVSSNAGARTPGVDKATVAGIETWIGVEVFLGQIRDSLKSGGFRPVEVRQVMIPKANGKLRKLGIPTIADRVVQASLKLVLEPIFEADFKSCSYGFRPRRRAQDAIAEIHLLASRPSNYQWVLECDIKACFDEISHTALMDRLRARIKDKRICALVKAFLKSGVLTELGDREDTLTGTPQGGILSPLLFNVAMSVLDEHLHRPWKPGGTMAAHHQRVRRRAKGLPNWRA